MYESPINQILGEMRMEMEGECMKVVQQCGFDVNKEELTKALAYDRKQYEKGFVDAIDELRQRFVAEYNEMMDLDMEENMNWAIRLNIIAEEMKRCAK